MPPSDFDPYRLLEALDRRRVSYVIVGALGRVIHGSGEVTDGLDVVPSLREDNLGRLALALEDLDARRPDGERPLLERDLADRRPLPLATDAGELKLVPKPVGRAATTTSAAPPPANHSARGCARRSPRSTTTPACWPHSAATRTASGS